MLKRTFFVTLAALAFVGCKPKTQDPNVTFYLVRHAEKTAEPTDPGLTEAGQARAEALAARLADMPLTEIYSTDFTRTRDTAAPTSAAKQIIVQIYNAGDISGFADSLVNKNGHILIVGHSNTTPALAGELGGDPGDPIEEATEFDRLYVIEKTASGIDSRIETYGN